MTKQQENKVFTKMLKEFPKAFGRVSFRERLMLKVAFDYVVEEIIVALEKENSVLKERYNKVDIIGYDALKNLTKAKELLKEFVQHYKNKTIYVENMQDLLEQSEQFIKDLEK